MTTPEDAPETSPAPPAGTPVPPGGPVPPSGAQVPPNGWGHAAGQVGYGQPRYGQYAPGGPPVAPASPGGYDAGATGAPQYGSPRFGGPQVGGGQYPPPGGPWKPWAAKPGIIPLRPLSLGEIYDGAFAAIRRNPTVMLGVVALVIAVATIVAAVVNYLVSPSIDDWWSGWIQDLTRDTTATRADVAQLEDLGSQLSQTLLISIAVFLASTVTTGLLIVAVSRSVINRSFTLADLWGQVRGKIGGLLVIAFLPALAILLVGAAGTGLAVLIGESGGVPGGVAVLFVLAFTVVMFVLAFWLTVRFLLVPAAYVLEGQRLGAAIKRGWLVSRRSFWRLLGIYLLSSIITGIVTNIVTYPGVLVADAVSGSEVTPASTAILIVANTIGATISTTFLSSVVALLYIDVRMRREGLDVELTAAAAEG